MYLPAICFICSTLFVKLIPSDALGDAAGTCGQSPWPVSDVSQWHGQFYASSDHFLGQPTNSSTSLSFSFLPPAELTHMGAQPRSSKELMPLSLGNRSGWPPAPSPSPGQGRGILHTSQEVPAELSSCCPQQQPWSFTPIWCLLPCPIAVFPSYFPGSPPQKRHLHLSAGPCGQPHSGEPTLSRIPVYSRLLLRIPF